MRKFRLDAVREFLKAAARETPDKPGRTVEEIAHHLACSAKTVLANLALAQSEVSGVRQMKPGRDVRMGQPESWRYYPPPAVIEGNPPRTATLEEHENCIAGMRKALADAGVTYDEAQHYKRQVLPNIGRAGVARHAAAARRAALAGDGSSLDSWLNEGPKDEA